MKSALRVALAMCSNRADFCVCQKSIELMNTIAYALRDMERKPLVYAGVR